MTKSVIVTVPVHRGRAHLIVPRGMRVRSVTEHVRFVGGDTRAIGVSSTGDVPAPPEGTETLRFDRLASAFQESAPVVVAELVPAQDPYEKIVDEIFEDLMVE